MYETHRGNLPTIRWMAHRLPRPCITGSAFVTIYRFLPNDTDFSVFQRHGWTGLNFAFIGSAYRYHTAQDTLENLSLRSLQHHGENALVLARAIASDSSIDIPPAVHDAVFFDTLGLAVVDYPESWAVPLAIATFVILLLRFGRQLTSRAAVHSALLVVASSTCLVVASGVLGAVVAWLLRMAGILWKAHVPFGGLVCTVYLLISVALFWFVARFLMRRAQLPVLWSVFWLIWSIAGIVLAATIPGFSYFLLVPALGAAIFSLVPVGLLGRMVLSSLVAAAILLPMANLIPVALGPRAGVVLGPVFTLVLLPLLPFLGSVEGSKKTVVTPTSVADMPQVAR